MNSKSHSIIRQTILFWLLQLLSCIAVFPLLWMLLSSVKNNTEIWTFPPRFLPADFLWSNYSYVMESVPFIGYFFNTFLSCLCIVGFNVLGAVLAAYVFYRFDFPGKKILFALILGTYMVPSVATYLPCYVILARMHLLDDIKGLILSNSVSAFGIFYLRQCFRRVNYQYVEAALMDGAGHGYILSRVLMPMVKTGITTFSLLSFINQYNSYLWPSLILKAEENFVLTIGIRHFYINQGGYGMKWGAIMACSAIATIPLVALFLGAHRWLISNFSDGSGIKG